MAFDTITLIENWYQEASSDQQRPILLSKLAIMELCGWIEEWMDAAIREVDKESLKDSDWTESRIIENIHGFHYDKHFRAMLCGILGEHKVREIERKYEADHGDLNQIKSILGDLWRTRCKLAHADMAAHQAAQVTIYAPSWTKNQFRLLSKRLEQFKVILLNSARQPA